MNDTTNIIRKESINFQISGNADGMVLQQEITGWCRDVLNPSVDFVLKEYEQIDETIFIDNINLDISLEKIEVWKEGLAEKIIHQLKEKIQSKITSGKNEVNVKSTVQNFYETVFYFLKYGILPWHSYIKTKEDFNFEFRRWIKELSSSEIKKVLKTFSNENSIKRFVNLLDVEQFETFISTAAFISKENISSLLYDVKVIAGLISGEKHLQQALLNTFRTMLVAGFAEQQTIDKVNLVLKQWLFSVAETDHIKKIKPEKINSEDVKKTLLQLQNDIAVKSNKNQKEIAGKLKEARPDKLQDTASPETENQLKNKTADNDFAKDKTGSKEVLVKDENKFTEELKKELEEGIFISNAGAVIIAPFLTNLFLRCGLQKENIITDSGKALYLLHYCITGNTNPAEFELLLPKILCGINPEMVIDILPLPNKKNLKEADEMLASVIEHWNVLKDTSITGLRESFLQRNGKLSFANNKWLLQVEQKPFDMLLQQLPWNISMIQLSWMQYILKTEWI